MSSQRNEKPKKKSGLLARLFKLVLVLALLAGAGLVGGFKFQKQVVYKGETNQPERREKQHRDEGKRFDRLVVTSSRRMTKHGAQKKEEKQLERYRHSHGGRNPLYNEETDG